LRSGSLPASLGRESAGAARRDILSGGPRSVYEPGAPTGPIRRSFDLSIPSWEYCYSPPALAKTLGGEVARRGGVSSARTAVSGGAASFRGPRTTTQTAWMSHKDAVVAQPCGFRVRTATAPPPRSPAMKTPNVVLFGVQFHRSRPTHPQGREADEANFLIQACDMPPAWTDGRDRECHSRRSRSWSATTGGYAGAQGASTRRGGCARAPWRSGGDTGSLHLRGPTASLRAGRAEQVVRTFGGDLSMTLAANQGRRPAPRALAGVEDPERKAQEDHRQTSIRVFEEQRGRLRGADVRPSSARGTVSGRHRSGAPAASRPGSRPTNKRRRVPGGP